MVMMMVAMLVGMIMAMIVEMVGALDVQPARHHENMPVGTEHLDLGAEKFR
jgi:hypothetical protein